jgi:hypothetical protein
MSKRPHVVRGCLSCERDAKSIDKQKLPQGQEIRIFRRFTCVALSLNPKNTEARSDGEEGVRESWHSKKQSVIDAPFGWFFSVAPCLRGFCSRVAETRPKSMKTSLSVSLRGCGRL